MIMPVANFLNYIELLVCPFIISVYPSGKTELVLDVQINLKL